MGVRDLGCSGPSRRAFDKNGCERWPSSPKGSCESHSISRQDAEPTWADAPLKGEGARVARIAVASRLCRLSRACAKDAAVEARPVGVSALTKRLGHNLLHARDLALAGVEAAGVLLCGARGREAAGRRVEDARVARGRRTGAGVRLLRLGSKDAWRRGGWGVSGKQRRGLVSSSSSLQRCAPKACSADAPPSMELFVTYDLGAGASGAAAKIPAAGQRRAVSTPARWDMASSGRAARTSIRHGVLNAETAGHRALDRGGRAAEEVVVGAGHFERARVVDWDRLNGDYFGTPSHECRTPACRQCRQRPAHFALARSGSVKVKGTTTATLTTWPSGSAKGAQTTRIPSVPPPHASTSGGMAPCCARRRASPSARRTMGEASWTTHLGSPPLRHHSAVHRLVRPPLRALTDRLAAHSACCHLTSAGISSPSSPATSPASSTATLRRTALLPCAPAGQTSFGRTGTGFWTCIHTLRSAPRPRLGR